MQEEIDCLVGDYLDGEHGSTWTLRAEEGKLVLLIGEGLEMEIDGQRAESTYGVYHGMDRFKVFR